MSKTGWREIVTAAGGKERAMLYGGALSALLDELASLEAERDDWKRQAGERRVDEQSVLDRAALAERRLESEKEALRASRLEQLKLLYELNRALALVEVVLQEPHNGVPSRKLSAAIKHYNEQGGWREN